MRAAPANGRAFAPALLVGPLTLLLAPAGCRQPPHTATIRIAHETNILSLDPAVLGDASTYSVASNVCEGLVAFDKNMRLLPALATSWNVDETTWVIELRKGVRFHDGGILTALHVKAALDRVRNDPDSGLKANLSTVEDVQVVGEHTLRLKTLHSDALLLNRLATVLVGRVPGAGGSPDRPVGTGPYRFVGWTKGGVIELASFEGYWGRRPAIDHVMFAPVEKERELALTQGRVDVLESVPETLVDGLGSVPGIRILAREGLATNYLWINSQPREGGNPFSDRRVRQAVSLAIDRRELVARLRGHALPANQFVEKGVFGYIPSLPKLAFDLQASRRLLVEAGHGDGFDANLTYNPGKPRDLVAEAVREMLARVGIHVKLQASDWPSMLSAWKAGRLPLFLAGWNSENGDASSFLTSALSTRDPAQQTGEYNPGFSHAELDRLIAENARIFGEAPRLQNYDSLMRLAIEQMPFVPLYHRLNFYGVSDRVEWEPRLDGRLLASEMSLKGP